MWIREWAREQEEEEGVSAGSATDTEVVDLEGSFVAPTTPLATSTQVGAGRFEELLDETVTESPIRRRLFSSGEPISDDDGEENSEEASAGDDGSTESARSHTPSVEEEKEEEAIAGPSNESIEIPTDDNMPLGESKIMHRVESKKYYNTFQMNGIVMTVKIREPPVTANILEWLEDAMRELHTVIVSGCEPTDMVGVKFRSNAFTKGPAGISYKPVRDFHFENLFSMIKNIAQSAAGFCIDDSFTIESNIVSMPVGTGRAKNVKGERFWAKKSVIEFKNRDKLCLPRAIVVGKVYAKRGAVRHGDLQKLWDNVHRDRSALQENLANELIRAAGVQIPENGCGIPELQAFQRLLAPEGIALIMFERETFGSSEPAVFNGTSMVLRYQPKVLHNIYLLLDGNHYGLILNLAQAAGGAFFCTPCGLAYSSVVAHRCSQKCPCCKISPPCNSDIQKIRCNDCWRFFRGEECLRHHKEVGSYGVQTRLCDKLQTCKTCLRQIYRRGQEKHECGYFFCRTCNAKRPENHQCFMPTLRMSKESERPDLFIFYDFETRQERQIAGVDGTYCHDVNLCVSQQRCTECIDKVDDDWECSLCGRDGEKIFKENALSNFVEYVLKDRPKVGGVTCIAHNAKGFDAQFILKHIVEQKGETPRLITNGTSIMEMRIKGVRFIDSLNYFHMSLNKLPKAFGLGEGVFKGVFPHLFNRVENENYKGPLPPVADYTPDTMSTSDREQFLAWYQKTRSEGYEFDFKKEIIAYCKTDVTILRKACSEFRKIFIECGDVCPFTEAVTIASACNKVYRRKFLEENKISVLPRNGYRRADRQSEIAIEWLLWCEHTFGKQIEHAGRGREHKLLDGTRVDGYVRTDDGVEHVLQFHGCFFHGCDKCYTDPRKRHEEFYGSTMNDRFVRTLNTSIRIKSLGYTLHEIWECEYAQLKRRNPLIKDTVNGHAILVNQPLNPRDAFFGGRTGNTRSYCETAGDEKIRYVDVCSLYPYICKYGRFPVGHPTVYTADSVHELIGPENDLSKAEGLVRCTVLPPRDLYHPVLPVRMHNRLMFALCRTCCEEMHQGPCPHGKEDDRAFEGTWVSCELQKAIEKGYKILSVQEIWHYEVEQYDKASETAGLFGAYINLWLKIKQEASGWPSECTTEESKEAYVRSFFEAEGVQLNRDLIDKNPGLRAVAKLCLNSFWGKFGQRENLPKTEVVTTRQRLLELLCDQSCEVNDIITVNDDIMYVSWQKTGESSEINPNVNVVIAAYTTAQARLKLYSYLEQLDKRVLYYDTDSCIYIDTGADDEYKPPLGNLLGDMTDELCDYGSGSFIKRFVSGGPKFYGYLVQTPDGREIASCKVKGIGLNYKNGQKINFESICRLVREPGTSITVKFTSIRRDAYHQVITKPETKTCKPVLVKRRRWGEHDSLPYGFKE